MPRIAISYRRADSEAITGRIFDRLVTRYGKDAVYRDIDNIPLGIDFRRHVDAAIARSDILIAVVGPNWVGGEDEHARLANPADPVRMEVEFALRRDIPVIPVLVTGASMPEVTHLPDTLKDFAYRHGQRVDAGQDFDLHMDRLLRAIDTVSAATLPDATPCGPTSGHAARPSSPAPLREEHVAVLLKQRSYLRWRIFWVAFLGIIFNAPMLTIDAITNTFNVPQYYFLSFMLTTLWIYFSFMIIRNRAPGMRKWVLASCLILGIGEIIPGILFYIFPPYDDDDTIISIIGEVTILILAYSFGSAIVGIASYFIIRVYKKIRGRYTFIWKSVFVGATAMMISVVSVLIGAPLGHLMFEPEKSWSWSAFINAIEVLGIGGFVLGFLGWAGILLAIAVTGKYKNDRLLSKGGI